MVSDKCFTSLLAELRQMMVLDDNTKASSDLNGLYKRIISY